MLKLQLEMGFAGVHAQPLALYNLWAVYRVYYALHPTGSAREFRCSQCACLLGVHLCDLARSCIGHLRCDTDMCDSPAHPGIDPAIHDICRQSGQLVTWRSLVQVSTRCGRCTLACPAAAHTLWLNFHVVRGVKVPASLWFRMLISAFPASQMFNGFVISYPFLPVYWKWANR